jgi:hypothetical protein
MAMRRSMLMPLLVVALLAQLARASDDDMHSPACRDALAALQAHEAAMAAAASAPSGSDRPPPARADARWRALRAQAARQCLGGQPDAPPPGPRGATAPAIGVPPVAAGPPPAPPAARPMPAPLPARVLPPFVTLCDGSGCWTSDGERLPQLGRSPFDARVHCAIQGRFVVCQ